MIEIHDGQSCHTHRQYRMDCAEFDALRTRASNHCEACGIPAEETPPRMLCIDHDHAYGNSAVRGLLCHACNSELGVLEKVQNSRFRIDQHERFGPYLRRSWHVQMVHWARAQRDLLGYPDAELQTLNEEVLRYTTVARTTELTRRSPVVTMRPIVHPGYAGLHVNATYEIGRATCSVALWKSAGSHLALYGVHMNDSSHRPTHVTYRGFSEVREHLLRLLAE